MSLKRILVAGGAGFIGSHLCDRFVDEGHEVLCVDNYDSGRQSNIAHLKGRQNFKAMNHDVTLPLSVEVDEIYNLACAASPKDYQRDPIQTMKSNVYGAINLLEIAKHCDAKILQASTSEVYGEPLVHPQTEAYTGNVSVTGPRACYNEGKRGAETLFFDYHRYYGVEVKVARIFNTYGPRMKPDDGRVVSNFIMQAMCGEPLTIYGDGAQTRSFCYVDDMIEALCSVMATGPKVTGPINLGNPSEVTIADLGEIVSNLMRVSSPVQYSAMPQGDPTRRCPDIALVQQLTGWTPTIALRDGVARTIEFLRDELGAMNERGSFAANRS